MATTSTGLSPEVKAAGALNGPAVLLGRVLFGLIFILSGLNHFSPHTIEFAASQGVRLASLAVPASGIIALVGGLSILLGYRARIGAWIGSGPLNLDSRSPR